MPFLMVPARSKPSSLHWLFRVDISDPLDPHQIFLGSFHPTNISEILVLTDRLREERKITLADTALILIAARLNRSTATTADETLEHIRLATALAVGVPTLLGGAAYTIVRDRVRRLFL